MTRKLKILIKNGQMSMKKLQGGEKKNRNFETFEGHFFEKIFFLKTSFLGVKMAEKHKSGVQKIF